MKVKKEKTYYFDISYINDEKHHCIPVGTYFMQCDHVPTNIEICNYLMANKNNLFENMKDIQIVKFLYFNENIFRGIKINENIFVLVSNIRIIC